MHDIVVDGGRRWALRRCIELDADVTDSDGLCYAGKVTDISEEGCSVRLLSGGNLQQDNLHTVNITGLPPLTAYVIWSSEGRAGLNLSEPLASTAVQGLVVKSLYAPLIKHLARSGRKEEHMEDLPPFPFD